MVHSLLKDLAHGICGSIVSRVVNVEYSTTSTSSKKHPVASSVHVSDDAVVLAQSIADCGLVCLLNALECRRTERVHAGPNDVTAVPVPPVVR